VSSDPSPFDLNLEQGPANFTPLSPLSFIRRSAAVYGEKTAVIHGARRYSYDIFFKRCRRLASALGKHGVVAGDTVAVMAPNVPELLEAHYGVPVLGAILNAINIRLDAQTIAFILEHGGAKVLLTDTQFHATVAAALDLMENPPLVIDIDDSEYADGQCIGAKNYETFIEEGDENHPWSLPDDEWNAISLNYTSGTTGNPKGVVYHHRGAYLNAIGNAMTFGLNASSVYLWTLPMFHCNGWTFTWGVTAVGGTHVCLRDVDPVKIYPMLNDYKVTHMCGAPVVLTTLIHAPDDIKQNVETPIEIATGGAAPPSAVISGMESLGFRVTHLYGMTESFGPSTVCAWQPEWAEFPLDERATLMARQGVNYLTLEDQRIADPDTMTDTPADGETMGELMLRGNTVMKGYFKNAAATKEAFNGGWLHTGDLGVMHPNGYIEIKDRAKDVIISGGENISSLEIEETLYRHPDIMEAAVVAVDHEKWGETPCAFVTLKPDSPTLTSDDVIAYCRDNMAHFKCPSRVVFGPLPKTSTGKIQKYVLRQKV